MRSTSLRKRDSVSWKGFAYSDCFGGGSVLRKGVTEQVEHFSDGAHLERRSQIRELKHLFDSGREIHQLEHDSGRLRPRAQRDKSSQSRGVDIADLGQIEHYGSSSPLSPDRVTQAVNIAGHESSGAAEKCGVAQSVNAEAQHISFLSISRPLHLYGLQSRPSILVTIRLLPC